MERVNHPTYYQHPSGTECIEIARHYVFSVGNAIKYLWRAGLKQEEGLSDKEKELEDIRKAVWYLDDYKRSLQGHSFAYIAVEIEHPSNSSVTDISRHYQQAIAYAIENIWEVGLIVNGQVLHRKFEIQRIDCAIDYLRSYLRKAS